MDETPRDPPGMRRLRLSIGIPGAVLLGLGGLFAEVLLGYADGTHGPLVDVAQPGRAALLGLVGVVGAWLVFRPERPDPRIARTGVLAVGLVGVVVGLEAYLGAETRVGGAVVAAYPGPGTWMVLLGGIVLVLLRWLPLWPVSRWEEQIRSARRRR